MQTQLRIKMCNVRTYVTLEYEMFSVQTNVIYENVKCSNICVLSELTLQTKIWYDRTHVLDKNMMYCVRWYVT